MQPDADAEGDTAAISHIFLYEVHAAFLTNTLIFSVQGAKTPEPDGFPDARMRMYQMLTFRSGCGILIAEGCDCFEYDNQHSGDPQEL